MTHALLSLRVRLFALTVASVITASLIAGTNWGP